MRPLFHPQLINNVFGDPGLYVDCLFQKRALLFDLGDIRALAPRKILRISHAFISHTHMDHFMGFDWLLRICLGRERMMHLYGPPGFLDQVEHKLSAYTWNLVHNYETDFTLRVCEIEPEKFKRCATFRCKNAFRKENETRENFPCDVLLDEDLFRISTVMLDHRTPSLAFTLEEKSHVNIWKNRLDEMGLVTGRWLQLLKRAVIRGDPDDTPMDVQYRDKTSTSPIALGLLKENVVRIVPGQKITYVTDAVYHQVNAEKIVKLAKDSDLLFIESTFLDELSDRAAEKFHLTAKQAGLLARQASVKQVIPFHISPIYIGEEERVHAELQQAFLDGENPEPQRR